MARQEGLIKLTGQMGGVSFYKTAQDGFLARTKGGVDGERIKNDAAFQRTRENGSEFGRAGTAGKLLRTAFRALTINTSDSRMASRLTAEMMKVIKADATNLRGERNVIDGEAGLLRGFEFNENAKLNRTFFAPYTATIDRTGGGATIDIPAFIPANMIAAPRRHAHTAGRSVRFSRLSRRRLLDRQRYKRGTIDKQHSSTACTIAGNVVWRNRQPPALPGIWCGVLPSR